MNEKKTGKPYLFPDSFILVNGYIRTFLYLPHRQIEGIIAATRGKTLPDNSGSYVKYIKESIGREQIL